MSSDWQQVVSLARRELRKPSSAHDADDDALLRAIYFLDEDSTARDEMNEATKFALEEAGWEVLGGPTLHRLPDLLSKSPDEYQLIVVFVGNDEIANRHDAVLRTLSGEFSFLIAMNCVTSIKTQCPLLSRASPDSMPLLISFAWFALQLSRSSSASQVAEIGKDQLRLTMASHSAAQTTWGRWMESSTSCQIATRFDGDNELSDESVQNLLDDLSHCFPSVQSISWVPPPERYFHAMAKLEGVLTLPRRVSLMDALCTSNNDNGGVAVAWKNGAGGAVLQIGESTRLSRGKLLSQLAARFNGSVTLKEVARLELRGCRMSTLTALSYIACAGAVEPATGLAVDAVRFMLPPPPQLKQAQEHRAAQPAISETPNPPAALPTVSQAAAVPAALPVQTPPPSPMPKPSPPLPPPPQQFDPEQENQRLKSLVKDAVDAALQPVLDDLRRTLENTRRELYDTVHGLELALQGLKTELHTQVHASAEAVALTESSVRTVRLEAEQLRRDLEIVKESAADQQLVVEAMNDLRARCATNVSVSQLEARLVRVVQANQELTESAHVAVAACRSHVEANSAEVETIMRRVELLHHQALDATLENSMANLSRRVAELGDSVRHCESNLTQVHASSQESIARLHNELRAQEAEYTKLVLLQRQSGSRLDTLQDSLSRFDSKIAGVVDEAVAATSHTRLHQLQEQVQSIKAYTAASVDRQSQLHSEQLTNFERKLTGDVQRVAEVLRKQQSSELDRIRDDVHKLQKNVTEVATATPAGLRSAQAAAVQTTTNHILAEELKMYKEKCDQLWKEQESLRSRVRQVEVVQTEVSDFVATEGERRDQQSDLLRRIEDVESSLIFLESRLGE